MPYEPLDKYQNKVYKYSCKYNNVDDIINQFNKDDVISPYLNKLKTDAGYLFTTTDTVIIIDKVPFLYAENLNKKLAYKDLVSVIKISSNEDDEDGFTIDTDNCTIV